MQKTKIEWADMTWNPVTGCLHGCEYCYARKIAQRFGKVEDFQKKAFLQGDRFQLVTAGTTPYPFLFKPTLHEYRLDEPAKIKKPQRIFVCSMADLFGEWVPDEWIEQVFRASEAAPQHTYMFLTKNPARYKDLTMPANVWAGATSTNNAWAETLQSNAFLSIEPLMMDIARCLAGNGLSGISWVIIGAETGNRKGKIIPKREWVQAIVDTCREQGVPVFMKDSLASIWGEPLIQE